MKINELELRAKAGVIPYYFTDNKELKMLFMMPSDPRFGGLVWQIAKGKVDPGETVEQAARREGQEELGLKQENILSFQHLATKPVTGFDDQYMLSVFAVEIKDPKNFGATDHETGKRGWLTVEQFSKFGRKHQLLFVHALSSKLL